MPGKTQNPDSWFYKARLAAGFPNAASLGERLDVPKVTVYQWERGSAAARPTHRPPARLMLQIAEALKVPLPDLLEALWREKDGDHCPCGRCDGKKSFSDTRPEAWTLAIVIPCAKCGIKRIRKQGKKDHHRKLCPTCAASVEPILFRCVGYTDHNAKVPCPKTISLRPFEINARQRLKDGGLNSRFDLALRTYQCNSCASLERLIAAQEEALRDIEVEQSGKKKSEVRIRTREYRLELFRKHRHRLYGGKLKVKFNPEAQERGRRKYIENAGKKKYPKKTRANLRRHWLGDQLPQGIRFGICIFCKNITMTDHSDNPRFHWACHNEWESTPEGRHYQSRKIREKRTPEGSQSSAKEGEPGNYGAPPEPGADPSSLAPSKGGRPKRYSDKNTGDDLATAYRWLIQYCSPEKKSLRQIGEESGVPFNTVRDQIRSLVEEFKKLPTLKLLAKDFRPIVRSLLVAYDERIREIKDRTISSIPSSNLPRRA